MNYSESPYGFSWGPLTITRLACDKGCVWFGIETDRHVGQNAIQVRVTKSGFVDVNGVRVKSIKGKTS